MRPWHVDILGRFLPTFERMLKAQQFITGADFTVADIILTCVLRELRKNEVLQKYPNVESYRHRCEARPAFVKVLNAYEDRLGIPRGSARESELSTCGWRPAGKWASGNKGAVSFGRPSAFPGI